MAFAAGVVVLTIGGCTKYEMNDGSNKLVNGSAPVAVTAEATVIGDYLDAINSADLARAMTFRCKDSQISKGQVQLFKEQTLQLIANSGPVEAVDIKDASDLTGVDGDVSFKIKGHGGRLIASTLREGGRDVLCSVRPAASFDIQSQLEAKIVDLGQTSAAISELIPDSVGSGYEKVPPAVEQSQEGDQSQKGELINRAWQSEQFGGVAVTAAEYPSESEALNRAEHLVDEVVPDRIATVKLHAAPDVVAVQFLGFAWLFAQSPSLPPYVVRAVLPFGEAVVTVQVSGTESAKLIGTLNLVVTDIVRRAGR